MKRQILTLKGEDIIPYVDGYGVEIGGTNLVDYLDQIESTFAKALLFLGAFATESALLTAYPNGSDLEDGTYAIVADTDTLYIYDTDNGEWLPTASNISGIMELNGLTPVSGALTITGGDINSTVSSAETQTQTITSHLNTLYQENDTQDSELANLLGEGLGVTTASDNPTVANGYVTYQMNVSARDYNHNYLIARFSPSADAVGTEKVKLTITDGTRSKTYTLAYFYGGSDGRDIKDARFKQLYAKTGLASDKAISYSPLCLIWINNSTQKAFIINWSSMPVKKIRTFDINSSYWNNKVYSINLANGGYGNTNYIQPKYSVISINKTVDDKMTTAVVDYKITYNYLDFHYDVLQIYSDETFSGTVAVLYDYE